MVVNDRSLGMVEQWQRLMYNRRFIGIKFQNIPDFVKLADAYGVQGRRSVRWTSSARRCARA